MKVLFVTPPYHCGVVEVAGRWVPLPFVYLAGSVRAAGHEAIIYDAMTKWDTHDDIEDRIRREQPDVVATTAITATINDCLEIFRRARKVAPSAKTVIGGVHPNFMYKEILERTPDLVDIVVRGEGEHAMVEILEHLGDTDALQGVKGIAFLHNDEVVVTPPRPLIQDLETLPTAFDLLDWQDYKYFVIENSRLGAVSTSRGCPHGCTFCSQQRFWNRSWRGREPKAVVDELIYLKTQFGVNVVLLSDEYPTANSHRWEELLDRIIAADLDMYLLMETRVGDILRDESILWKYRKAGIVHVYMGVEATDQETLDLMKKDIEVEMSQKALALVREHGMVTETSLVLGFPHETPESIERTLKLAQHFDPDNAHFLAITPWPYAEMYPDLEPHIVDWDYSNYNLIEPIVKPEQMTIADLNHAMVDCYRKFYMGKLGDFLSEPDPFRKHYLVEAARLIMGSSFIKKKMLTGAGMPKEVRKMIERLTPRAKKAV